jgi:DNA-binding transcriptional ArsR family regulator
MDSKMTPTAFLTAAVAVADPTRWRMLMALRTGPLCVGQLAATVGVTSSAATYHLRRMRDAGLVATEREGRRTIVRRVARRWAAIVQALAMDEALP